MMKLLTMTGILALCTMCSSAQTQSNVMTTTIDETTAPATIPADQIQSIKNQIWETYKTQLAKDPIRQKEIAEQCILFNQSKMRFSIDQIGEMPEGGYPLFITLHGGGSCPSSLNDGQWNHMKIYYKKAVKNGIYVAVRGITDTWNLHFVDNSFPMYDRLIENMIALKNVNPNRVYVLGFSAGGDGVYQIASRMSDRFAAANMSAGHPNNVSMKNLANLPFLIQLGERDGAFKRNRVAVEYTQKLDKLAQENPSLYTHQLFLHRGKPHNFSDNLGPIIPQEVITGYNEWLSNKPEVKTEKLDTNAIRWTTQYTRNPIPKTVIWDLNNRAESRSGIGSNEKLFNNLGRINQFYWLDLGDKTVKELGTSEIRAKYDPAQNAIIIEQPANWMRILLSYQMLDLSKPIKIQIGDFTQSVNVVANQQTLQSTLESRGDPSFMFEADILIQKKDQSWSITPNSLSK